MDLHYPQHIGIIPDGNRTWAKEHGKPSKYGHYTAYKLTLKLIGYVFDHTPIKAITFRWLSTENLKKRTKEELDYLYEFSLQLKKDLKKHMEKHHINFKRVWNPLGLPQKVIDELREIEALFTYPTEKYVIFAINYGWRDEIIRGIKLRATHDGNIDQLSEATFSSYLDFASVPPVDLVIRTKGELASRISGFMLRWIGYAELFFSTLHFPDFDIKALQEALQRFHERSSSRNFWK